jgi:phage tail protein X
MRAGRSLRHAVYKANTGIAADGRIYRHNNFLQWLEPKDAQKPTHVLRGGRLVRE